MIIRQKLGIVYDLDGFLDAKENKKRFPYQEILSSALWSRG